MNIFKVLCSGDGTIKEPNISAFLAYLLNPNEDHGLSSSFLEKFLEPFLEINEDNSPIKAITKYGDLETSNNNDNELTTENYILDLSPKSKFVVNVALEKALRGSNTQQKQIVDIIVKIEKKNTNGQEDVTSLFSPLKPVAIILIENKINADTNVGGQLVAQFANSQHTLSTLLRQEWDSWRGKICSVLVSPDNENKNDEMQTSFTALLSENVNSCHIKWSSPNNNKNTITTMIKELINDSFEGITAPIPSYSLDTLRALNHFINDNFSSNVDDEQAGGSKKIFKSYDTMEQLLEDRKDENFCSYIDKNLQTFKEVIQKVCTENNLKAVFSRTMVAFKPQNSGKANILRFDYKKRTRNNEEGLQILLYRKPNSETTQILNNIFEKDNKNKSKNDLWKSTKIIPLDEINTDTFYEIFRLCTEEMNTQY